MQTVIDNLTINYNIIGEGEKTVVILQGWGTTMEVYKGMATFLSQKFRVVTLDLPGFGESSEPPVPWNVDAYTDFLLKFLKCLRVSSAIFVGHSYGGRMLIKLAARENPGVEIEKLILVDAAGVVPKKSFKVRMKIRRYKTLKSLANLRISQFLYHEHIEEWKARQGSADYRAASEMMKKCLVMAVNEDLTPLLSKIKAETLLVWGDKDEATPLRHGEIMDKNIPNSGLAIIHGAGHYSFLEQPVVFNKIIESFLKDI